MTVRGRMLIAGVGVNDSPVPTSRKVNGKMVHEPCFILWFNMINRCYRRSIGTTYEDVSVCDDWHIYSKFQEWYKENGVPGWHLDKDMVGDGKLYSPATCNMLPLWMNVSLNSDNHPAIYYHKGSRGFLVGFDPERRVIVPGDLNDAITFFHKYFIGTEQHAEWCAVSDKVKNLWLEKKGLPKDIWLAMRH